MLHSMNRFAFCSSLRRQSEREAAVTAFRAAKWKGMASSTSETRLETHDAELSLPAQQSQPHEAGIALRSIFLTSKDVNTELSSEKTWKRIERLYYLKGSGKDAIVVFILRTANDQPSNTKANVDVNEFMKLQADLVTKDLVMPTIPSATWIDLPKVLTAFHHQLCVIRPSPRTQHHNVNMAQQALQLLCHTAAPRPLSEHSVHVLSDLTANFRNYLEQLADPDTRENILSYLGEEGQRALTFWVAEQMVD